MERFIWTVLSPCVVDKNVRPRNVEPLEDAVAYTSILHFFFAYPERTFTLSELAKSTGTPKTTAGRVVEQLIAEAFLHRDEVGRSWQLKAQRTHPFFMTRKIPDNLRLVYESGVIDQILRNWPAARCVILFGSYRKGDDTEASDVDIAIEIPGDGPLELVELGKARLGFRTKAVRFVGHFFRRKTVDKNLFANIANGIVLAGFLEVR